MAQEGSITALIGGEREERDFRAVELPNFVNDRKITDMNGVEREDLSTIEADEAFHKICEAQKIREAEITDRFKKEHLINDGELTYMVETEAPQVGQEAVVQEADNVQDVAVEQSQLVEAETVQAQQEPVPAEQLQNAVPLAAVQAQEAVIDTVPVQESEQLQQEPIPQEMIQEPITHLEEEQEQIRVRTHEPYSEGGMVSQQTDALNEHIENLKALDAENRPLSPEAHEEQLQQHESPQSALPQQEPVAVEQVQDSVPMEAVQEPVIQQVQTEQVTNEPVQTSEMVAEPIQAEQGNIHEAQEAARLEAAEREQREKAEIWAEMNPTGKELNEQEHEKVSQAVDRMWQQQQEEKEQAQERQHEVEFLQVDHQKNMPDVTMSTVEPISEPQTIAVPEVTESQQELVQPERVPEQEMVAEPVQNVEAIQPEHDFSQNHNEESQRIAQQTQEEAARIQAAEQERREKAEIWAEMNPTGKELGDAQQEKMGQAVDRMWHQQQQEKSERSQEIGERGHEVSEASLGHGQEL